jgi:hypothetical protein
MLSIFSRSGNPSHSQRQLADLELPTHTSTTAGIIVPICHLTYHAVFIPVFCPNMDVLVSATRIGTLLADDRAPPPSCLEPPIARRMLWPVFSLHSHPHTVAISNRNWRSSVTLLSWHTSRMYHARLYILGLKSLIGKKSINGTVFIPQQIQYYIRSFLYLYKWLCCTIFSSISLSISLWWYIYSRHVVPLTGLLANC